MANEVRVKATLQDDVSKPLTGIKGAIVGLKTQVGGSVLTGVGLGAGISGFNALNRGISDTIDFMGDAIQSASNLNETVNKSQVVFGDSARGIEQWGASAATSMGLSENAAISAAATIGNLLLSTGTAPEKIAPMSKSLVQLASDLASFNNISTDDALAKLESGLVGQERPLRELGVAISAASVDTEAATLGFHKLNGEFTEGEKVQARYALIFQQTATAQGDFARTSDQLANSQRILNAEIEDAKASIGNDMLPVVRNATVGLNDFLAAVGGSNKATVEGLEDQLNAIIQKNGSLQDYKDLLGQLQYEQASLAAGGLETTQEVDALNNSLAITQFFIDRIAAQKNALKDVGFEGVVSDLNASSSVFGQSKQALEQIKQSANAATKQWVQQVVTDLGGVKVVGKMTDEAFVAGLKSGQSTIDSEWDDILNGLKHRGERGKQIGHDIGILTSKALQTAIQSGDPELSATARDTVQNVLDELDQLRVNSRDIGTKGMKALRDAMNSSNPEIARAAWSIFETIQSNINLPTKAYSWGRALADGAALGLGSNASQTGFEVAAERLMAAALHGLEGGGTQKPKPGGSTKSHSGGNDSYNPQNSGVESGINIHVHSTIPPTPAQAAQIAKVIVPIIKPELQRQGLIPR